MTHPYASPPSVPFVVNQHVEDIESLRITRSRLVRAPHINLRLLRRLDDRIAAHQEGVAVAYPEAAAVALTLLESPRGASLFTNAVIALESRDLALLDKLLALAEALPETHAGLKSAFGWVTATSLRGVTKTLLDSPNAFRRDMGLAACMLHGVDPGPALQAGPVGEGLSTQALVAAGRLGRVDLLPACLAHLADEEPRRQFEAARSALLLGDREQSVHTLIRLAESSAETLPELGRAALTLAVKVLDPAQTHTLLSGYAKNPAMTHALIASMGAAGDPRYVPWLIKQMSVPGNERCAGEAFSMICGADLVGLKLDREPPAADPTEDTPQAIDIGLDDDLPWPDATRIAAWWHSNGEGFSPGMAYFVGARPTAAHCASVLKQGWQRQRMAAADRLCLLQPGTALFNVAAPAWRQERQLARLGA